MMLDPVRLPPGRARLATTPAPTGSPRAVKTIGIVEVALFAVHAEGGPPLATIKSIAPDKVVGKCRQPIIAALRPAVFDRHVLSLDIPGFGQALPKRCDDPCRIARRSAAVEAEHRHRLLLGAGRERICHALAGRKGQHLQCKRATAPITRSPATSWSPREGRSKIPSHGR